MPAIKPHHTDTTDAAWDGPKAKANLKNDGDAAYYRSAFAWVDPGGDAATKSSYKFIHHEVAADGTVGPANIKACQTGCGVLNGGMGGSNIPDADRQGVWNHLAMHLKDAGLEAPELRSKPKTHKYELRQGVDAAALNALATACRSVIDVADETMERVQTCPNNTFDSYMHALGVEFIKTCITYAAIVLRDAETNDTAELADDCMALADVCDRCADICGIIGDSCEVCADDTAACVTACETCDAACDAISGEPDDTGGVVTRAVKLSKTAKAIVRAKDMDEKLEIRSFHVAELRVIDGTGEGDAATPPQLDGYPSVFNVKSEDLGGWREIILPGAFDKTIQEADVRALINHDPNLVIGRTKNQTLTLKPDIHGLRMNVQLPDTTYAKDLMVSVKRGDIDQMSFAFQVVRDQWQEVNNGGEAPEITRMVREVKLLDVSPVTFPAYPQTSVYARSMATELRNKSTQHPAPAQAGHPGETAQAVELELERMRWELAIAEIEI